MSKKSQSQLDLDALARAIKRVRAEVEGLNATLVKIQLLRRLAKKPRGNNAG